LKENFKGWENEDEDVRNYEVALRKHDIGNLKRKHQIQLSVELVLEEPMELS